MREGNLDERWMTEDRGQMIKQYKFQKLEVYTQALAYLDAVDPIHIH